MKLREKIYSGSNDPVLLTDIDYWTKRLHVDDWKLVVQVVPHTSMDQDDNQGDISIGFVDKQAKINILRHEDWLDAEPYVQNMELTLIHELVHILFVTFEPKQDEDEEEETLEHKLWHQMVEHMAVALLETRYDK